MEDYIKEREDREVIWSLLSREAETLDQLKLCEKFEVLFYERQGRALERNQDINAELCYSTLDKKDDFQEMEDKTVLHRALSEDAERLRQLKFNEKCETQYHERQVVNIASNINNSNQDRSDRETDKIATISIEDTKRQDTELQKLDETEDEGKEEEEEEEEINCYQEDGKDGTELDDDDDQDGCSTKLPPVTEFRVYSGIGTGSSVELKDVVLEDQNEEEERSFQSVGIQTENNSSTSDNESLRKDVKDSETQTEVPDMTSSDRDLTKVAASLGTDSELLKTMREERSKRLVMEQMVKIVESEATEQRYQLLAEKNRADKLEMDLIDTKAELSHTTSLAVEYKTRVFDLEDSLQGARKMITNLEEKLTGTEYFKGGVDYMLENKLAQTRTTEAEKNCMVFKKNFFKRGMKSIDSWRNCQKSTEKSQKWCPVQYIWSY